MKTIINNKITYKGETKTMKEWAFSLGLNQNSFKQRYLKYGINDRLFRKKSQAHPKIHLITWQRETLSETAWANKLGINVIEFNKRFEKWGADYRTFAPSCPIDNRFIQWQNQTKTKQKWAQELKLDYCTFLTRLKHFGVCDRLFLKKNNQLLGNISPVIPYQGEYFIKWEGKIRNKKIWSQELGIAESTFKIRLKKYGICDRTFLTKNNHVLKFND